MNITYFMKTVMSLSSGKPTVGTIVTEKVSNMLLPLSRLVGLILQCCCYTIFVVFCITIHYYNLYPDYLNAYENINFLTNLYNLDGTHPPIFYNNL
jgi:hypothetical protein